MYTIHVEVHHEDQLKMNDSDIFSVDRGIKQKKERNVFATMCQANRCSFANFDLCSAIMGSLACHIRRVGVVVERSPRMREIGVRFPVGTDLSL